MLHSGAMSEHRTTVPPPPPPSVPAPARLPHPVALFAVAFGIGAAAALVSGLGVGALVYSMGSSNCSPSDGWCELGAAVLALLAGVVVGAIAYAVAGIVTIFKTRPAGRRGQHVLAHLTIPFATYLLLALLSGIIQ